VTNARAGDALYLRKLDTSKELEQIVLWKDNVSASLFAGVLTITPDFNVLFTEFFMVTDCMFLDIYRDYRINSPTISKLMGTPSPSEAKFFVLPREVRYDLPHYRLRLEPEEVDGHRCYVLEYPEKDLIWVDPACNFAVRKRCNFQALGYPLYVVENTDLTEKAPGVWIPSKTSKTVYHSIDAPQLKGKIHATEVNVVKSCKINELTPDSFLPLPIKEGYFVDDQIRGVSYKVPVLVRRCIPAGQRGQQIRGPDEPVQLLVRRSCFAHRRKRSVHSE
jgi:hypothetical protein